MAINTRLFVGNLPNNANENDLQSAFSSYGNVTALDLKSKTSAGEDLKRFAFVTLSASLHDIESCIKDFSNQDFKGNRLYVTRARESFLERLQRERNESQQKQNQSVQTLPKKNPIIKLSEKLNPRKRKYDNTEHHANNLDTNIVKTDVGLGDGIERKNIPDNDKKKQDSDKKRMDSMKKKRQEFKEKQNIIKTGLIKIDKVQNKRLIFSENLETPQNTSDLNNYSTTEKVHERNKNKKSTLFDDEDSGDEVNFEIKNHFEGKKGQKVLDLQSTYKSDKRFVLDERFVEEGSDDEKADFDETIDKVQTDEKSKQLDILQNVLGVQIKSQKTDIDSQKKTKSKLGMLRFDPSQPGHAKFLAPVEETKLESKKSRKKNRKENQKEDGNVPEPVVEKIEVSKEQFYKVSETLKEAIAKPTTFSLRSLFGNNDNDNSKIDEDNNEAKYIPIQESNERKFKNPLAPKEKNPFKYDSSDSESDEEVAEGPMLEKVDAKVTWKENLFFTSTDSRLTEGLAFFNKSRMNEVPKERRELKSLMKKRIYNKERKNQMFQKKIGGRKKTMKKSFRRKS